MHAYGQTGMKAYMRTHTDRKAYIHNTYMQTDLQSEGEARVRVRQESERCKSEGETRVRATQEARVRVRNNQSEARVRARQESGRSKSQGIGGESQSEARVRARQESGRGKSERGARVRARGKTRAGVARTTRVRTHNTREREKKGK